MAGEPLRRFVEESYAQLRLDGKTHEQAMAEIREAISEAIPHAVAQYMDELSAADDRPLFGALPMTGEELLALLQAMSPAERGKDA